MEITPHGGHDLLAVHEVGEVAMKKLDAFGRIVKRLPKMRAKNVAGVIAVLAGLIVWGISISEFDFRLPVFNRDIDTCREIRKANDRIGLLVVSEVITKDVIYLKEDCSTLLRRLALGGALVEAVIVGPIGMASLYLRDKSMVNYAMDPGWGIIWGHQGIIEYVVDLSQAEISMQRGMSTDRRATVKVELPNPYPDPESVRLNLESCRPILKNKKYADGDPVVMKMEMIAKRGFEARLKELAETNAYLQDARSSAKMALMAIYASVVSGADVDVDFKK